MNLGIVIALSVLDSAIANIALAAIAKKLTSARQMRSGSPTRTNLPSSSRCCHSPRSATFSGIAASTSLVSLYSPQHSSAPFHSLAMLTLGRALQGFGAAGITSVNTALVRFRYPRRQLGRGIAMVSVVVSISSAAGPSIAAAILAVASWPWLFAFNVPVGLLALFLSFRLLPYNKPTDHRFDLMSALCSRPRSFPLSVTASVCAFVANGAVFVALPFYFQDVIDRSQVETGPLMTPWPVRWQSLPRSPVGLRTAIRPAFSAA